MNIHHFPHTGFHLHHLWLRRWKTLTAIAFCSLPLTSHAGDGVGTVGQVLVGRNGNQVFFELLNPTINGWPCGSTHPSGFRYVFLLTGPGDAMLAAVLAAQAAGREIQVVGAGVCNIESNLETASYVIVR
jgi:hypothetical protein